MNIALEDLDDATTEAIPNFIEVTANIQTEGSARSLISEAS